MANASSQCTCYPYFQENIGPVFWPNTGNTALGPSFAEQPNRKIYRQANEAKNTRKGSGRLPGRCQAAAEVWRKAEGVTSNRGFRICREEVRLLTAHRRLEPFPIPSGTLHNPITMVKAPSLWLSFPVKAHLLRISRLCALHTASAFTKIPLRLLTPIRHHSSKLPRWPCYLGALQMALGRQRQVGDPGLRGSEALLYQHTCDDEDSQGHDGDHHQGGDGLLLLAGSHHGCQEVCVFTAWHRRTQSGSWGRQGHSQHTLRAEVSFAPLPGRTGLERPKPYKKAQRGPSSPGYWKQRCQ